VPYAHQGRRNAVICDPGYIAGMAWRVAADDVISRPPTDADMPTYRTGPLLNQVEKAASVSGTLLTFDLKLAISERLRPGAAARTLLTAFAAFGLLGLTSWRSRRLSGTTRVHLKNKTNKKKKQKQTANEQPTNKQHHTTTNNNPKKHPAQNKCQTHCSQKAYEDTRKDERKRKTTKQVKAFTSRTSYT